jgi:hypothetical protein
MATNNYAHLNANGTTLLCPAPCEMQNVNINTLGTAANTLTLYDSATTGGIAAGNMIAQFNTTGVVATFNFNVQCRSGLVAVLATGVAADVTICFR